jgi:hypothetical protein
MHKLKLWEEKKRERRWCLPEPPKITPPASLTCETGHGYIEVFSIQNVYKKADRQQISDD